MTDLDFSDDIDADLLAYMAMKEDDPGAAEAAWAVLYIRHHEYLYKVLYKLGFVGLLGSMGAADLVQETFRRAYEKADKFEDRSDSAEGSKLQVRRWLVMIAKRLYLDLLRKEKQNPIEVLSDEFMELLAEPPVDREISSDLVKAGVEAWETVLSEPERDVLRASIEFLVPGEKFGRMPNGYARALADSLGTTTAGMRMKRKRAIAKLQSFVEGKKKGETS